MTLEMVPIPMEEYDSEMQVRDVNDRPILRAALNAKADILLTGDKDFLESGLVNIPLRRSRLSGKMETTCPDRRKPL